MFESGLPVVVVLADRPCEALSVGEDYGAVSELVDRGVDEGAGADEDGLGASLAAALRRHRVDLVALSGFEGTLSGAVHRAFPDRILNTHPSLLPALPGNSALAEALATGAAETGCTVNLERPEPGPGPILAQEPVKIVYRDTEETLRARIEVVERSLYPATVSWALDELEAGREIVAPPRSRSADTAENASSPPAAKAARGLRRGGARGAAGPRPCARCPTS